LPVPTGYFRTVEEKAAAVVESVAGGHCFTDGNKRTSLYLLNLLLRKADIGSCLWQERTSTGPLRI
jgi:prophage maintenance system killer protein